MADAQGAPVVTDGIVRFERVSKQYGPYQALFGFSLDIEAGRFVTLLGPSGCGKSTTLRLLGGFEQPSAGRIFLAGRDVTAVPANQRNVNMVFQDYALFPHLNVERNVAFGLEVKGQSRASIARRVAHLLELTRMGGMARRMPDQLSGGQRQRVALARALAREPDVLLLDEPLGALDAQLRMDMQSELKDLHEQTGKTFVLVTHDQEEAMAMSDTIVVMNGGRIEQVGPPVELYHRPRSRFVAGFIGHNNILQCRVVGGGAEMVLLDWHGYRFQATADGPAPAAGETVFVALRPESIACGPEHGGLVGQVRRKVFRGTSTTLAMAIPDGSAHGAPLTATLDPGRAAALGETVQVSFPPGAARVLTD